MGLKGWQEETRLWESPVAKRDHWGAKYEGVKGHGSQNALYTHTHTQRENISMFKILIKQLFWNILISNCEFCQWLTCGFNNMQISLVLPRLVVPSFHLWRSHAPGSTCILPGYVRVPAGAYSCQRGCQMSWSSVTWACETIILSSKTQNLVLWKSRKCSYPVSLLFSPSSCQFQQYVFRWEFVDLKDSSCHCN